MHHTLDFDLDIRAALDVLRKGGIILYPTDTVWGLGCDATNHAAVSRIYHIKRREDSKSMLSLVDSAAMLERTVENVPDAAWQLIEAATDPITIIYDHPIGLASNLLAPDGSAGIRITSERFSRELCRRLHRPIVSTSANISGQPTSSDFQSIDRDITEKVDYIASYGRDLGRNCKPSGIIKISDGGLFRIIR